MRKKYLDPKTVIMLKSMSLRARLVVEGYIIGQHRSPYHGFSVEFAEHRSYGIGDEIKHIDWKLYGKTDRLYIKRYEEETNLAAYLILDISKSMLYKSSDVTKLSYANTLAASISYLMINQQDSVGLVQFSNKINSFIVPKSKPSQLNVLLKQLDDHNTGQDTNIGVVIHEMAERIRKRGLVILISDLLDDPKEIINGLKHFRHMNQEVIVFHILDRREIDFNFNSRTKFLDMESGEEIITEPWLIKSDYVNIIKDSQNFYKKQCNEFSIDYIPVQTDMELNHSIRKYLNKRKKLN